MPILQVLIISLLGAFLASGSSNILHAEARKTLNKMVFMVFTPSLMFASLAKTVTLQDIISWWFMPVNIGLTFVIGGFLGWILVKLLKPDKYMEGLIVAVSSSGNLGNLPLIIVPAICEESGSPFGELGLCRAAGLSYASFSMALGGFFVWTYTYQLIRTSAVAHSALLAHGPNVDEQTSHYNKDIEVDDSKVESATTPLLKEDTVGDRKPGGSKLWGKVISFFYQILEELMAPPTLAATLGLIFGATTWLRNLIIGEGAPLRVIQDSIKLLGDGTIPSITLILGGNLAQGLKSSRVKAGVVIGVVCVRYLILPVIGIGIVKAAGSLGFLPSDPLYHFTLMLQFTLPPAMNIGTMTQLFDVGQEECSVLLMWTYMIAALALTVWSSVYMWVLSEV